MADCKKCLLLEAGENVTYDEIMAYIATLDKHLLTDDKTLKSRLAQCRKCEQLLSGMCRKCGCYVEVRARMKNETCPDYDNRKW